MTITEIELDEIEATTEIQERIARWNDIKKQRDAIEAEMKDITNFMAERIRKRAVWSIGDDTYAVSVVRANTKVVDYDLLAVTDPELYGMVTKSQVTLDTESFNKAMELGLFANGTPAAKCLSFKPKAPSLRFGKVTAQEEGADDNA